MIFQLSYNARYVLQFGAGAYAWKLLCKPLDKRAHGKIPQNKEPMGMILWDVTYLAFMVTEKQRNSFMEKDGKAVGIMVYSAELRNSG